MHDYMTREGSTTMLSHTHDISIYRCLHEANEAILSVLYITRYDLGCIIEYRHPFFRSLVVVVVVVVGWTRGSPFHTRYIYRFQPFTSHARVNVRVVVAIDTSIHRLHAGRDLNMNLCLFIR